MVFLPIFIHSPQKAPQANHTLESPFMVPHSVHTSPSIAIQKCRNFNLGDELVSTTQVLCAYFASGVGNAKVHHAFP